MQNMNREKLFVCHTCRIQHRACGDIEKIAKEFLDFSNNHQGHNTDLASIVVSLPLPYAPNANIKLALGTSTSIGVTGLNSLVSSATTGAMQSDNVDNSSNLYLDCIVQVTITAPSTTPEYDKCAYIYAYGSEDGTNYVQEGSGDDIDGSDGSLTLQSPTNLTRVKTLNMTVANEVYRTNPFSIALAFGGVMPRRWGLAIRQYTGYTLPSSGHSATYSGVYATSS